MDHIEIARKLDGIATSANIELGWFAGPKGQREPKTDYLFKPAEIVDGADYLIGELGRSRGKYWQSEYQVPFKPAYEEVEPRPYYNMLEEAEGLKTQIALSTRTEDFSERIKDYNQSIYELRFATEVLNNVVDGIAKNQEKRKTLRLLEEIKERLARIVRNLANFLEEKVGVIKQKIDEIVKNIGEGIDKLSEKLRDAYNALTDFIHYIFEKFLRFCETIKTMTKSTGIRISHIDFKFPNLEIESTLIGTIPIPKLRFSSPEVTVRLAFEEVKEMPLTPLTGNW